MPRDRALYHRFASSGGKMALAAHLFLHERPDPEKVCLDGRALAEVLVDTAHWCFSPFVFSLMDLELEREWMLRILGVCEEEMPKFRFKTAPAEGAMEKLAQGLRGDPTPRLNAQAQALRNVSSLIDLVPVGMVIGPFSLLTKVLDDPIVAVSLAARAPDGEMPEDDEAKPVSGLLEMCKQVVMASAERQIMAGARAICVAEPAACTFYISPHQLEEDPRKREKRPDAFDRFVMRPNRELAKLIESHSAELVLHSCGVLTDDMVRRFGTLDPVVLSLGSSRTLWEDVTLVEPTTILFGNLPTKLFYSDGDMPIEMVLKLASELTRRMRDTGRHFILGSECDVQSVQGFHDKIKGKVRAFLDLEV